MPCQRIKKLGTRAHRRDRSAAETIFTNRTYFLDNPRNYFYASLVSVNRKKLVLSSVCGYGGTQLKITDKVRDVTGKLEVTFDFYFPTVL